MNYWIIKSEPDVYSFDRFLEEKVATWDGVRNYQARNNLRAMEKGDLALFYHSNIGLEVVGIAKVFETHFPDPTAEKGDWSAVRFIPHGKLGKPVPLSLIKNTPELGNIALVRNGRLSVMPLNEEEFDTILKLGETKL
jgi:predicted RNA-binding protein with PUA-like domain